jgi:hypothetical protein
MPATQTGKNLVPINKFGSSLPSQSLFLAVISSLVNTGPSGWSSLSASKSISIKKIIFIF